MDAFKPYADSGKITLPTVPEGCVHNAHMFYIKFADLETRQSYIAFMKEKRIMCVFHYVPLHSAPAGSKFGRFAGEDVYTTSESDRLVRLPMYYRLAKDDLKRVIDCTKEFIEKNI
jgi:dTDP-4-amino-4,6-dideoxygalactose transaminase